MAIKRKIAALDIGSTKIGCFIGESSPDGPFHIKGVSHQASAGIRNGLIVDMDDAFEAISSAVHSAEQMAGEQISSVYLALGGAALTSQILHGKITIGGAPIRDNDIKKVIQNCHATLTGDPQFLVHAIPLGYQIDGAAAIAEPRNMYAQELGLRMHMLRTTTQFVQNLALCVRRCHLSLDGLVVAPYAAGLATLVEDEKNLGVTVVDLGGGTTSMAVFYEGSLIFADSIPIGGIHVTNDIARGLSTPIASAEKLKTLYGSTIPTARDDLEMVDAPQVGEEDSENTNRIPRRFLVQIIRPRIEETLELVKNRLETSGFGVLANQRIVLTGGGAQLTGIREMTAEMLCRQVRIGRPIGFFGLAEAANGPAFASTAGLLSFAQDNQGETRMQTDKNTPYKAGMIHGLRKWFKENI